MPQNGFPKTAGQPLLTIEKSQISKLEIHSALDFLKDIVNYPG